MMLDIVEKYEVKGHKNQGQTKQKKINNLLFGKEVVSLLRKSPTALVAYLDGEDCRTTQILKDLGVPLSNCVPINDNLKIVTQLNKITANAIFSDFSSALDKFSSSYLDRIEAVWYDGCSTLLGNDKYCPIEDIEKLLSLIPHNFLLAITFCTRGNKIVRSSFVEVVDHYGKIQKIKAPRKIKKKGQTREKAVQELRNTIETFGFEYDEIAYEPYKHMVFWMGYLKITK